ncbi:MAG: hypothetical protein U0P45_08670 [Acidimicrobiales bacterium]
MAALAVAALAVATGPADAGAPTAPRATRPMAITPSSGPAGTTITASSATPSCIHRGINDPSVTWPGKVRLVLGHVDNTLDSPNEDQWIDAVAKADSIANPDGTWSATITAPKDLAPGTYDVAAVCFLPWIQPPWATSTTVTGPAPTTTTTSPASTTTSAVPSTIAPARQPRPRTLDSWVLYGPATFTVTEADAAGAGTDAPPATPVDASAGYTG